MTGMMESRWRENCGKKVGHKNRKNFTYALFV